MGAYLSSINDNFSSDYEVVEGMVICGYEAVEVGLGFVINVGNLSTSLDNSEVSDNLVFALLILDMALLVLTLSKSTHLQSSNVFSISRIHMEPLVELGIWFEE